MILDALPLIILSALSRVPAGFAQFFTPPLEQIIQKTDNHDIKRAEQLFAKSDRLFCFLRENPKRLISSGRQSYLRKPNPGCRNSQHRFYAAVHPLLPMSDCHYYVNYIMFLTIDYYILSSAFFRSSHRSSVSS